MTVVIGLYPSDKSEQALMLTDEKRSYHLTRTSDIADKIRVLDDGRLLAAGTGVVAFMDHAADLYAKGSESDPDVGRFVRTFIDLRGRTIDAYLQQKFGIGFEEFKSGVLAGSGRPIDQDLKHRFYATVDSNGGELSELFNTAFLLLDRTDRTMHIIDAKFPMVIPVRQPYATLGSGSDLADASLARFYEDVPREDRMEVGLINGTKAALLAIAEAARNEGVGGVPSIAFIEGTGERSQLYRPDQRSSKLLTEIVRADAHSLLDDSFASEAIEALLRTSSFKRTNKEFMRAAKKRSELELFLRGYHPALS